VAPSLRVSGIAAVACLLADAATRAAAAVRKDRRFACAKLTSWIRDRFIYQVKLPMKRRLWRGLTKRSYNPVLSGMRVSEPCISLARCSVQFQHSSAKYLRFGSDYVFSPSVFNHFNAGLNGLVLLSQSNAVNGTDYPALLEIKGASGPTFPEIGSTSDRSYGGLGYNNDTVDHVNALVVSDSVSAIRGAHTARFGLDLRQEQFSHANVAGGSGSYDFERYLTAAAPGSDLTGDGFASFLLGQVNQVGSFNISIAYS